MPPIYPSRSIRTRLLMLPLALLLAVLASPVLAQVKIGVVLSLTGPGASLGIPARDTVAMLPTEIAGQKVQYLVLDDASDMNQAVRATKQLIDGQHVDAIIGSSLASNTLAMLDVVAARETPTITLASSATPIGPVDAKRRWLFETTPADATMAEAIVDHAAARGVRTIAYIGELDALGLTFYAEIVKHAQQHHIALVAHERFNRTDPSVTHQALRIVALHPDAVVVGANGTAAAMVSNALKARGYKGLVYQHPGVGNREFPHVCGAGCNGALVPASPVLVAEQLPADSPERPVALDYQKRYEAGAGPGSVSTSGAHTWDAALLLGNAIPVALKTATPGTSAFRRALRDALEATRDLPDTSGVVNMSRTDHLGLDPRQRMMVEIRDGNWVYPQP